MPIKGEVLAAQRRLIVLQEVTLQPARYSCALLMVAERPACSGLVSTLSGENIKQTTPCANFSSKLVHCPVVDRGRVVWFFDLQPVHLS